MFGNAMLDATDNQTDVATKPILMMCRNYEYRGILSYYLIIFIFIYQLFTVLPDFTFFIIRRSILNFEQN